MDNNKEPQNSSNKTRTVLIILAVLTLICLCIIALIAIGLNAAKNGINNSISQITSSSNSSPNQTSSESNTQGNSINVVDKDKSIDVDGVVYTLNNVTIDGENYLLDMTINNTRKERVIISSLIDGVLSNDRNYKLGSQKYASNILYVLPEDKNLDIFLEPGNSKRGVFVRKVTDNPAELYIHVLNYALAVGGTFKIK